jgi:predicted ATPase
VNRVHECRIIDGCLDRVFSGQGGVLLIEGPAGIGKTCLARELTARAQRRGCRALVGSAYEMEGAIAYGPFIDILQAALRESPADQDLIPAEIAGALSGRRPEAAPVPNSDPRAAQSYLFAAVAEFLRRRALAAPQVVVVENLHAADQVSRELFHFLARRLRDAPLLLVATLRDSETAGRASDKLLRGAGEAEPFAVLALGPLSAADHHELLRQQGDEQPLARERSDEIFRLSEGNPLYALELHAFLGRGPSAGGLRPAGTIPPSLRANVLERLSALSPGGRRGF